MQGVYADRLLKYEGRGFSIVFPGLRSSADFRAPFSIGTGLDAAFYGGPRLSTVQAMAVPLTELTAMCRGHPQHGVPIEAALFVAGNAKRLRVR